MTSRCTAATPSRDSYAIEEFHREGILFENAFLPLDLTAMSVTMLGPDFMRTMAAYDRLACFGFFIEDSTVGTVRPGPGERRCCATT